MGDLQKLGIKNIYKIWNYNYLEFTKSLHYQTLSDALRRYLNMIKLQIFIFMKRNIAC